MIGVEYVKGTRAVVLKDIGGDDPTPYLVAQHGKIHNGTRVLIVVNWHETEQAARAQAHGIDHPEY